MKRLYSLLLLVTLARSAAARELNGVTVGPTKTVENQTLILNGVGLRTATILNVKIYVASLYTPKRLTTPDEVTAAAGPLWLDLTYLREFSRVPSLVVENWLG